MVCKRCELVITTNLEEGTQTSAVELCAVHSLTERLAKELRRYAATSFDEVRDAWHADVAETMLAEYDRAREG